MCERHQSPPHASVIEGVDRVGDVTCEVSELLTNSSRLGVPQKWTFVPFPSDGPTTSNTLAWSSGAMEEELSPKGEATSQGETVVGEVKCVPGAGELPQQSEGKCVTFSDKVESIDGSTGKFSVGHRQRQSA